MRVPEEHLSMEGEGLTSAGTYRDHLLAVSQWLLRSERPGGGSAAFFTPLGGWSRAYPETTGYLIPTLLELRARGGDPELEAYALRCGAWLHSIQNRDGSWNAGLHPPRRWPRSSVFNTGQVLKGMMALWRWTGDEEWLGHARRGAAWVRAGLGPGGLWEGRDYRIRGTPSYYTEVVSVLIDVALSAGDGEALGVARGALEQIATRVRGNGAVEGWGFGRGGRAFTHTIAYVINGFQESARLLADPDLEAVVWPSIQRLLEVTEAEGGRLPGAFDLEWKGDRSFVCLTGNAQLALVFLREEERSGNRRFLHGAFRLLEVVRRAQSMDSQRSGIRGGIAGSIPLTGPYMRLRYPNWAGKFAADAFLEFSGRVGAPSGPDVLVGEG